MNSRLAASTIASLVARALISRRVDRYGRLTPTSMRISLPVEPSDARSNDKTESRSKLGGSHVATEMAIGTAAELIERIQQATNEHDLDALVACFNETYLSEMPVHPGREFRGNDQVRRTWTQIF